ncbi:23S rRNA (cytidine(2498)-2'-O)-methyltransferase RlmM [Thioalkalivibrio sp. AKL12]|uniref:23S rRNA (cytidine(2498)-2'-O)-methyltransferase RlmM n=1 Tax=Thioalkalivibrio sp. AKL12 TaxID=1158159 RepID=UPI00035DDDFC|nr:23S rRNA (cytidine(2498)-2'-O)-methyltransferase RlmM [Thioalkalivibrio sp. AKL12]
MGTSGSGFSGLLLYCRAGFEADLTAELTDRAARAGLGGFARVQPGSGYVHFEPAGCTVEGLARALPFEELIFARQVFPALPALEGLDRADRLTPIIEQAFAAGCPVDSIWHEMPDTNEGKGLRRLIKAVERPLASVLRKRGVLRAQAGGLRLHVFWHSGDCVQLGLSRPGERSEWPGGILHLRSPREAPSRSTLKLEEAWHTFIPRGAWDTRLAQGMQAVDLGAAPGGWTWQLVRRGMYVHAVDNGPMDAPLMATTQVEHHREDAFSWVPPKSVTWLVCDIVDKPSRVAARMADWLEAGWCREAIFNLKLPMKQRWKTVYDCLDHIEERLLDARITHRMRARQLYHDREEITVHVERG